MKLRFTPEAVSNIADIGSYISEQNPAAALRVEAAIRESIDLLIQYPEAGRSQTTPGVRKLVTRKFAYLVYYAIERDEDAVVILSIVHPARDRRHEDE